MGERPVTDFIPLKILLSVYCTIHCSNLPKAFMHFIGSQGYGENTTLILNVGSPVSLHSQGGSQTISRTNK